MMDEIDNQLTLHDDSTALLNAARIEQVSASHIHPCLYDPWYVERLARASIIQQSRDAGTLPVSPSDVRRGEDLRV